MTTPKDRFVWALAPCSELAERVVAEIWWAGGPGVVEERVAQGVKLMVYLPAEPPDAEERILNILQGFRGEGLEVREPESASQRDWSEAWKEGLGAVEISSRLVIRPSFVEHSLLPGQVELVIDPGQAFGTGQHESTRLLLEWVDELSAQAAHMDRVLDVGTGTGVLAMAAVARGARWAVGFDLDLVALREALRQTKRNRLHDCIALYAGPIDAVISEHFDLVLVNLLRSEMDPIVEQIACRVGCRLLLAGLLESDRETVIEQFARQGLRCGGSRQLSDASGNVWWSPLFLRD